MMEHSEIARAFSTTYNKFYLKYRDNGKKKTDEEWDEIMKASDEIIDSFEEKNLIRGLVLGIMEQLELSDRKYK